MPGACNKQTLWAPVLFAFPAHPAILEARRVTDSSRPLGHPGRLPRHGPMPAGQVTVHRSAVRGITECDPLNTNTSSVRQDPAPEAWAGIRLNT